MPETPSREAWSLMGRIFMENRRSWGQRFGELGLAPMQAFALRNLDPKTPMAMSALADVLHCDNSNVTGIADLLEAAGLVERRTGERDRRVKTLALTDRGTEVRQAVIDVMSQPPPPIASLSAEDARALRDVLRRATGAN
jgi:DNA-binding MarR family transcriptional regulator